MKIHLLLSVGLLMITSCSKFLDVKPVGKLIPTELEEFDNLLYSQSTIENHLCDNNKNSLLPCLTDYVYISDNRLKYFYSPTYLGNERMAAYIFSIPYLDFNVSDYYLDRMYAAVRMFNTAIDGVKGLGMENDKYGREIIAQARAGRAWSLFVTGICYAQGYKTGGVNDAKTIPYRTESDPTRANPNLSTLEQLYELVKSDLEFAAEYCPSITINPTRANKAAANSLLAFMYMNKCDYENMYKYSKIAWDMTLANNGGSVDRLIYDYNAYKYETKTPPPIVEDGIDVETVLELESPDQLHEKTYNRENLFYRIAPSGSILKTQTLLYPTKEYLDLFSDGDRRAKLFLLHDAGYRQTFSGVGPGGSDLRVDDGIVVKNIKDVKFNYLNMGITHPDLLLMLAESAARTNRPAEAMTALRLLRKYRYTPATAQIADMTGDALIVEILDERVRELPLFSPHRYWDLKRFARETGKPWSKQSITHKAMGEIYTAEINSDKFQIMLSNNARTYNPQWKLPQISGVWSPYKYGNPF